MRGFRQTSTAEAAAACAAAKLTVRRLELSEGGCVTAYVEPFTVTLQTVSARLEKAGACVLRSGTHETMGAYLDFRFYDMDVLQAWKARDRRWE